MFYNVYVYIYIYTYIYIFTRVRLYVPICLRFLSSLIGDGSQETVNSLAQSFIKTLRYKPLGITPTTRAWATNLSASIPPLRKSTHPKRQMYQMNIPDLQILIARFGNNMKQVLLISAVSDIPSQSWDPAIGGSQLRKSPTAPYAVSGFWCCHPAN